MKSWCIAKPSAKFVAKMEDVLEVYQRPYDAARPVVCLDEKSKELHATPHGSLPPQSGATSQPDNVLSGSGFRVFADCLQSRTLKIRTLKRRRTGTAELLSRV